MSVNNPFFDVSLLPYQAPRFDVIEDSHYRPAFDEAMRLKRADIDAIIAQSAVPDFNNTVLALEKSGAMLSRVSSVFFAMTSAHQRLSSGTGRAVLHRTGRAGERYLAKRYAFRSRGSRLAGSRHAGCRIPPADGGDVSALCSCGRASERR